MQLRFGDVIAIEVVPVGRSSGVIASLQGDHIYGTGGIVAPTGEVISATEWRATKKFETNGDKDAFAKISFNKRACTWRRPRVLPRADEQFDGKSEDFPYSKETPERYVWAHDSKPSDSIYLRLVYGLSC